MKYLKNFEEYDINEWLGQKFITGFDSGEKEIAKKRLSDEIDAALKEFKNNPNEFIKYDENTLRKKLLKEAEENGYRGKIEIKKSKGPSHPNKNFITYRPITTSLQDLGSDAASATTKKW